MNQFIQHISKDVKGLRIGPTGKYINGNSLPFINDSKTGGKTICFWVNFNTLIATSSGIINLLQVRDEAQSVPSVMLTGVNRLAGQTSNESRMAISQRRPASPNGNIIYGSIALSTGIDYLMVYVTTGTEYKLHLNGIDQTLTGATDPYTGINDGGWFADEGYTLTNCNIGVNTTGVGGQFNGEMYMMAYWDKALSGDEVTELFNSGDVKDPTHLYSALPNLVSYYRMGEREFIENSVVDIFDSIVPVDLPSVGMTTADIISH